MVKASSAFAAFGNRTFRNFWIAAIASNLGGQIQLVGAAWLMTSLSPSQGMVALVQTSNTLPLMVGSFAAGVLADNLDRRKIMITAQVFMLVASVVLAALSFFGGLQPWTLLAFTFLIGCGTALHYPSWLTSIGEMVNKEDLSAAVSLNAMGMNITRSVGPAAGGAIVAFAGTTATFVVNALSFIAMILMLYRWKPQPRVHQLPPERFVAALGGGLRYFAMSPTILRMSMTGMVFGFSIVAILALLPLLVQDRLGGSAFVYGVLLGCFGGGAVMTAMANHHIRSRLSQRAILRGGFLVSAACASVLAVSPWTIVSAVAMIGAGICWLGVFSLINVTVQMSSPRWIVGRMLALYMTSIFGGMAAGGWLWGQVCERFGIGPALLSAAGCLLVGTVLAGFVPMPLTEGTDLDPANVENRPSFKSEVDDRDGPVWITIEYLIDPSDVPEFLVLMTERRRARMRDGARRWTLSRDLESERVWQEGYHFPTWLDYRRHRDRITRGHLQLTDRIAQIHRGTAAPYVRRAVEQSLTRYESRLPGNDRGDPLHPG